MLQTFRVGPAHVQKKESTSAPPVAGLGVVRPEHWIPGWLDGAKGKGVVACRAAVMADSNCAQDYFTYVSRGDLNCGCKKTKGDLKVRRVLNADY